MVATQTASNFRSLLDRFGFSLGSSSGLQDFLIVGNGGWQIIAIVLVVQFFLVPIASTTPVF
jgi:hypothetical protein